MDPKELQSAIEEPVEERLGALLETLSRHNPFYRARLADRGRRQFDALPLTTKAELSRDQADNPPFGTNLTYPPERYVRLHQTSGTTGAPLRWLDTAESWQWFVDCWKIVFQRAGVTAGDRVFVAFSFGPFIGFWGAFEAAQQLGCLALSGGAMDTEQRLRQMCALEATVLVSTPTYALRLIAVAEDLGLDLPGSALRLGLHAGEPGASLPNVRRRIEDGLGVRCVDHAGATEVGAWGVSSAEDPDSMEILSEEFIAEVIDPESGRIVQPDGDGRARGELVLTNLGRLGSPVVRYRTGDLVEMQRGDAGKIVGLRGGVIGRVDDMQVVRGVNVYPGAVENLMRRFDAVVEYQARIEAVRDMRELNLYIEARDDTPELERAIERRFREELALRVGVHRVEAGSLPRFELKARRLTID